MPEPKKATLKSALTAEVEAVLARRPGLTLVKLADEAADNWEFLTAQWPEGVELVDFFHAAEQLKAAFDVAYGEQTPKALAPFQKYRHILLEETHGVEQVIRMLCYLRKKHPRRKRIEQVLGYFRRHRHRMRYAAAKAHNLPVGSGVVEAACKTLATQRLKRSGMHWRQHGGQAILTLRTWLQSNRFDHAWHLLSDTYRADVSIPENIIAFPRQRVHWMVNLRPTPNPLRISWRKMTEWRSGTAFVAGNKARWVLTRRMERS